MGEQSNAFSYGLTIKKIAESLGKEANSNLTTLGITVSQIHVLKALYLAKDKTLALKALEGDFHMAQSTIAGLVNRLEKKQLVEQVAVDTDKRVKHIRLTTAGEQLLIHARSHMLDMEQKLTCCMTPAEADSFRTLLIKAYDAFR